MKQLAVMVLCLCFCLMALSGCGDDQELSSTGPSSSDTPNLTSDTGESPLPSMSSTAENQVAESSSATSPEPSPTISVRDSYAAYGDDGMGLEYHIPEIVSTSSVFEDVNQEIFELFYDDKGEHGFQPSSAEGVEADGYPFGAYSLTFTADGLDGIHSLCLKLDNTNTSQKKYYVYNLSEDTGELVDAGKVKAAFGMEEEDYGSRIREAAASCFLNSLGDTGAYAKAPDETISFMIQQYEKTLSEENLAKAVPYIYDAQLYVVIPVYAVAGADYYWQSLNISNYTPNEGYGNEFFYHIQQNSTVSQEGAVQEIPDEELVEAAKQYYENLHGMVPSHVEVDHYDGDNVVIHIYDVGLGHTSTLDWYTVNRYTGIGTDFMGSEIDLMQ